MNEVWKDVVGYEGLYEVSNSGKVRMLRNGNSHYMAEKRCQKNNKGYLTTMLSNKDRSRKRWLVHRLVAIAFLPNPNNFPEVNHKDENKLNNHVGNLEWCDHVYNSNYGSRRNSVRGEKNPMRQYKEEVVREIKEAYIPNDKEFGVAGLAKKYGMSQTHVCAIVKGRRWGWVKSS